MRILVTGANGRFGSGMVRKLAQGVYAATRADFDFTDFSATRAFIHDYKPEIIIHPAAWTDVDGCAREPEKAIQINGFGTQHIAIASAEIGCAMVYISSNEVFDGRQGVPYREYDTTQPANPYGYSKMVGERALLSLNPKHYIVRTAWLFAHGGKNFIQAIFSAAEAGKRLRVVTDEVANPTYNDDLVDAVASLIKTGRYGIYHFVNSGACSRYTFARYILDNSGYPDVPIEPISSREWSRPSHPPTYSSLANMAGEMQGITLRSWQAAVDAFLEAEGLLKRS
ncbi:MAG: dTDP-4-dehydrorhamnose reductase [Aggregatilineales bacterium]